MSIASLVAEIEELQACVRDMNALQESVQALGKKASNKAQNFRGVRTKGSWTGDAADEFDSELGRAMQKVAQSGDHASKAVGIIGQEIFKTQAILVAKQAELAAARAWEAMKNAVD